MNGNQSATDLTTVLAPGLADRVPPARLWPGPGFVGPGPCRPARAGIGLNGQPAPDPEDSEAP